MIALLSGAWWAQKLAGVTAQAIAVALVVALVVGGFWWLRHDARMDERASWGAALAKAEADLLKREREAEAIAIQKAAEWQAALAASEAARIEAEAKLASRARVVCYPKEIVRALNK